VNKRVLGLLLAVVLAGVGTAALVFYVQGAADRAAEGEELATVFVVASPVLAGTPGSELAGLVSEEQVPVKVRPIDAVTNLEDIEDRVASVDLVLGEQLLASRFVDPSGFNQRLAGVEVPPEHVEVTVTMSPERFVGGLVRPGQRVSIIASLSAGESAGGVTLVPVNGELIPVPSGAGEEEAPKSSTDTMLRKVLVSAVQRSDANVDAETTDVASTPPSGAMLITLAVSRQDAERIVYAAEFERMWMVLDGDGVPDEADPPINIDNLIVGA